MKSINKYLFAISAFVLSFLAVSCNDSVEYSQAEKLTGAQVYFSSSIPSQINLDREKTSYSLKLMRQNTEGDLTVELNVQKESDKLEIPASAVFKAGENSTNVDITYSLDELGYDNYYNVVITLSDGNYSTPYGLSSLNISVGIPAPWVTLGKATYQDDILMSAFGIETEPYKLDIQQNGAQTNLFRLVNPYGKDYPAFSDIEGQYDTSKDYYIEFSVSEENKVVISQGELGVSVDEGTMGVATLIGGEGTMTKDSIITFPAKGLAFTINGELWNYVNNSGKLKIAFPTAVLADYELGVSYAGKFTNNSGVTEGIVAEISKVGEDVESVRLAVIEGNDEDIDTAAVLKTSEEVAISNLPVSHVLPFKEQKTGFYTIVAIAQDGDKVVSVATSVFKYNEDVKEVWIDRYKGKYSYAIIQDQNKEPAVEEDLIMSQNQENPTLWKISGSEVLDDFTFTYDQETGDLFVNESTLLGGTLYVANSLNEDGTPIYGNKNADTFTFKVKYYDPYGPYGDYEETYVITGYASDNTSYTRSSFDGFIKRQINKLNLKKQLIIPFE